MMSRRTLHTAIAVMLVTLAASPWWYRAASRNTIELAQMYADPIGEGDAPIGGPMAYGEPVGNGPIGGPMIYGDPVGNAPIGGPMIYGNPVGNAPIGGPMMYGAPVNSGSDGAPIGGDGETLY